MRSHRIFWSNILITFDKCPTIVSNQCDTVKMSNLPESKQNLLNIFFFFFLLMFFVLLFMKNGHFFTTNSSSIFSSSFPLSFHLFFVGKFESKSVWFFRHNILVNTFSIVEFLILWLEWITNIENEDFFQRLFFVPLQKIFRRYCEVWKKFFAWPFKYAINVIVNH